MIFAVLRGKPPTDSISEQDATDPQSDPDSSPISGQ